MHDVVQGGFSLFWCLITGRNKLQLSEGHCGTGACSCLYFSLHLPPVLMSVLLIVIVSLCHVWWFGLDGRGRIEIDNYMTQQNF